MAIDGIFRPGRPPRAGKRKKPKIVYEDDGERERDSGPTRTAGRAPRAGAKRPAPSLLFWIAVADPSVVDWLTTDESGPGSGGVCAWLRAASTLDAGNTWVSGSR